MEPNKTKVIIGVPVSDSASMRAQTAHSIGSAIIGANGLVVDFLLRQSCDIVSNRTWLVQEAQKKGATHLFFVDADMAFPAFTIKTLLAHNVDIVGVKYNRRKFPLEPTHTPLTAASESETGLFKCAVVGTGIMLINMDVFKNPKFGAPSELHPQGNAWFSFGRDKDGKLVLGEDAWFCNVARDAGYDVWCDPVLSKNVRHIGEFAY